MVQKIYYVSIISQNDPKQNYFNPCKNCLIPAYASWPCLELVSKELNHLVAILHVYAGGLIFMK